MITVSRAIVKGPNDLHVLVDQAVGHCHRKNPIVFLRGDLGAGKTTLVRAWLANNGFQGIVSSPSYNIVNTIKHQEKTYHHFDCYRLSGADELIDLDVMSYLSSTCFFEWPEKAAQDIIQPDIDITIDLSHTKEGLAIREFRLQVRSDAGNQDS